MTTLPSSPKIEVVESILPGMAERGLWLVVAVSTSWMAAVGWFVQLVHYPGFRFVRDADWSSFHQMHSVQTGYVVVVPMLAQFFAALLLVLGERRGWEHWAGLACMALSFGWTMAVSGPMHGPLRAAFQPELVARLIDTGWIRAVAWTAHAAIAAWVLIRPSS